MENRRKIFCRKDVDGYLLHDLSFISGSNVENSGEEIVQHLSFRNLKTQNGTHSNFTTSRGVDLIYEKCECNKCSPNKLYNENEIYQTFPKYSQISENVTCKQNKIKRNVCNEIDPPLEITIRSGNKQWKLPSKNENTNQCDMFYHSTDSITINNDEIELKCCYLSESDISLKTSTKKQISCQINSEEEPKNLLKTQLTSSTTSAEKSHNFTDNTAPKNSFKIVKSFRNQGCDVRSFVSHKHICTDCEDLNKTKNASIECRETCSKLNMTDTLVAYSVGSTQTENENNSFSNVQRKDSKKSSSSNSSVFALFKKIKNSLKSGSTESNSAIVPSQLDSTSNNCKDCGKSLIKKDVSKICVCPNTNTIIIPSEQNSVVMELSETLRYLIKMEAKNNQRYLNNIVNELSKQRDEIQKITAAYLKPPSNITCEGDGKRTPRPKEPSSGVESDTKRTEIISLKKEPVAQKLSNDLTNIMKKVQINRKQMKTNEEDELEKLFKTKCKTCNRELSEAVSNLIKDIIATKKQLKKLKDEELARLEELKEQQIKEEPVFHATFKVDSIKSREVTSAEELKTNRSNVESISPIAIYNGTSARSNSGAETEKSAFPMKIKEQRKVKMNIYDLSTNPSTQKIKWPWFSKYCFGRYNMQKLAF